MTSQPEVIIAPKSLQKDQDVKHLQCDKCKKFFKTKAYRDMHISVVHYKENNTCNVCQKSLCNAGYLRIHLETAHGHGFIKKYLCIVCEKSFGHRNALRIHVKLVHDKIKDYKCDICQKTFGPFDNQII